MQWNPAQFAGLVQASLIQELAARLCRQNVSRSAQQPGVAPAVEDHHSGVEILAGRDVGLAGRIANELVDHGDNPFTIAEFRRSPVIDVDGVGVEVEQVFGVDEVEQVQL